MAASTGRRARPSASPRASLDRRSGQGQRDERQEDEDGQFAVDHAGHGQDPPGQNAEERQSHAGRVAPAAGPPADPDGQGPLAASRGRWRCPAGCWPTAARWRAAPPPPRPTTPPAGRAAPSRRRTSRRSPPGRRRRRRTPRPARRSRRAGGHRCRTSRPGGRPPPRARIHHDVAQARARPTTPATPNATSAARLTAAGDASPVAVSRTGPTRASSVPRMPSE